MMVMAGGIQWHSFSFFYLLSSQAALVLQYDSNSFGGSSAHELELINQLPKRTELV